MRYKGVHVVRRQRNFVNRKKIERARARALDYTVNRETEKEGSRRDSLHDDEGGRGQHWLEGRGRAHYSPPGPATRSLSSPPAARATASRLPPLAVTAVGSYDAVEGVCASRTPIACLVLSHSLRQAGRSHVALHPVDLGRDHLQHSRCFSQ